MYGLEAVVPMEFITQSLRVAVFERLLPEESLQNRVEELMNLEEDRFQSSYVASVVKNRRIEWVNRHLK